MKLEVGMFVRFKRGFILANPTTRIAKLISNINDSEFWNIDLNETILENDIIKSSTDLIDLIEVGDVVGITESIDKFNQVFILGIYEPELLKEIKTRLNNNQLKLVQVLTKEQFESTAYKVGD